MEISLKLCQGNHAQVYRVKMMQNGINSHQRVNRGSRVHQLGIYGQFVTVSVTAIRDQYK